jgi:hypothetical protein
MTGNDWIALGKILGVGLLAGAGLPALFTVGLRLITPAGASGGRTPGAAPRERASFGAGMLCFAAVVAAISYGIYLIVRG